MTIRPFQVASLASAIAALAACGPAAVSPVDVEDQAAAAQALIDGGDTLEEAGGEETIVDDEAALDEADPAGTCDPGALRARVIARYDADGDGTLGEEERAALRADVDGRPALEQRLVRHRVVRRAVLERLRFVYDADESGDRLDEIERAELRADLIARCEARRAQILERYDANGSGELDADERAALVADREARIAERRAEVLARFDADGNGVLGAQERAALLEDVRARAAQKRAALRERFDANGDGALDAQERDALREHLRERIRLEGGDVDEETVL